MPNRLTSELTPSVVSRLRSRNAGVFSRIGEDALRAHVSLLIEALVEDVSANQTRALRSATRTVIAELTPAGLTFSDLRFLTQTIRAEALAALDSVEGDDVEALRAALEAWLFELAIVSAMRFITQRDAALQQRNVSHEMQQLEHQLGELETALGEKDKLLSEKTQLLELIRQASTPIAPVVRGVLVVPLVGTFDAFRAELLTERLLHEIARTNARAALLDVSGVPAFDTTAAHLIIRLARSVRMLGALAHLVGLSPESARTLVSLGIELEGIETHATLQDGLSKALRRLNLKIVSTT